MREMKFSGHKVVGGRAEGEALVSPEPICFLGGVNVNTGEITEKGHVLQGKSMKGKVLVFPTGKGSTGGSYLIYETSSNGAGPVAMLNRKVEAVTAIGCIIGEIPVVDRLDPDPVEQIQDGDYVIVDADQGLVTVIKKESKGE